MKTEYYNNLIIHAIDNYIINDDDKANLFIYLKSHIPIFDDLSINIDVALEDMGRCPRCGAKLETRKYIEYNNKANCSDDMTITYCPNCE